MANKPVGFFKEGGKTKPIIPRTSKSSKMSRSTGSLGTKIVIPQKEFQVFSFEDLPKSQQDDIIENYEQYHLEGEFELMNMDTDIGGSEYEWWKDQLSEMGIEVKDGDIDYSFDTSGRDVDYVKIDEYKVVDEHDNILKWFKEAGINPKSKEAQFILDYGKIQIDFPDQDYRGTKNTATVEFHIPYELQKELPIGVYSDIITNPYSHDWSGIENKLEKALHNKMEKFSDNVKANYDYISTREAMINSMEANEWQFTKGKNSEHYVESYR